MKGEISDDVKQAARELRSQGKSLDKIAAELNISHGSVHKIVKDIKPEVKPKVEPKVEVEKSALPSSFDKFKELGASVGVEEPLLSAASDFVFRMGADDVKAIYNHLKGIVRIDLAKSWAKLYGGYLGQDLKLEPEFGGEADRFVVVGDSIMRDPGGVTYGLALKELEARLKAAQPAQPRSLLDDVTGLASLVSNLKAAFGGGGNSQGSVIQLKDGTLSLADFLSLKKFEVDNEAKRESDNRKMEIASGFKDLLTQASKAVKHITESEEE